MGNAESSQSPEHAGLGGFNDQSSFRRQSPNIARLIHGEHSQKMEYEFPISESTNSNHFGQQQQQQHSRSTADASNHQSSPHVTVPTNDHLLLETKLPSSETSGLWFSLASCFGCRAHDPHPGNHNPLRDKVHAIRIVRASNDLTPAVFDSHYNIITLEQLRECESNGSDPNESTTNPYDDPTMQHENGSVKTTSTRRMRKKKKKQKQKQKEATKRTGTSASRPMTSDDDEPERT